MDNDNKLFPMGLFPIGTIPIADEEQVLEERQICPECGSEPKQEFYSRIVLFVTLVFLLASLVTNINMYSERENYKTAAENMYQKSLYQATAYIDDVGKLLTKARLSRLPAQCAPVFADIWKQASAANDNLSSLPYNHELLNEASQYLSQASDLSHALMAKSIDGTYLENEDWKKVAAVEQYASWLSTELNSLITQVSAGETIGRVSASALLGSISALNKQSQNYTENIKVPGMTEGKPEIDETEGITYVKEFLKERNISRVSYTGWTDDSITGVIPSLHYNAFEAGSSAPTISMDITKYGGYPIWMLDYGELPDGEAKSPNEALRIAEAYLIEKGFQNMKSSYYEIFGDTIVIDFVHVQDEVTVYSDLIKVKLSLAGGKVIGFEAKDYLNMHTERTLKTPLLPEEAARNLVSPQFEIKSVGLAMIPLESKTEVLCYEYKGAFDGKEFIIYINADNGKQEKIVERYIDGEN